MCLNTKSKYFALIDEQIVYFNTFFHLLFVLQQGLTVEVNLCMTVKEMYMYFAITIQLTVFTIKKPDSEA